MFVSEATFEHVLIFWGGDKFIYQKRGSLQNKFGNHCFRCCCTLQDQKVLLVSFVCYSNTFFDNMFMSLHLMLYIHSTTKVTCRVRKAVMGVTHFHQVISYKNDNTVKKITLLKGGFSRKASSKDSTSSKPLLTIVVENQGLCFSLF